MRYVTFAVAFLLLVEVSTAQKPGEGIVVTDGKGNVIAHAISFQKPDYPRSARAARIEGKGNFLLRLRRDGTVSSVETVTTTGHVELDTAAKNAFIKWRFKPGPTEVPMPIEFSLPR
jgi:TonB family protein